jgi:alkylation response protein AidB-like acyl-CoA dehydrogenase
MGRDSEPALRQRLAQAHVLGEVRRMNTERHKAVRAAGGDIPGIANFSKLLTADILRLQRDLGMELLGARGMLHGYGADERRALDDAVGGTASAHTVTGQALQAQALPIFGGTDQIQRNIIGERVLGLPKDPGDLSRVPFNELPRNG